MLLETKIILGMVSDTPMLDHEAMTQVLKLTGRGRGRGLGPRGRGGERYLFYHTSYSKDTIMIF